jgi:hypothetical protein
MLIRLLLFATGLVSFLYFLFPSSFDRFSQKDNDVLGISKINASVNISTVKTALLTHCISEGYLPDNLNDLYEGYLMDDRKLDLDNLFSYEINDSEKCVYTLKSG